MPVSEIVAADAVSKRFGAVRALHGVSFRVERPSILGILGPNGAGKTTLLSILEGLLPPTDGAVRLFGEPIARSYPRRRVGVVLQRESALDGMTAHDYASLFASLYRLKDGAARILSAARLDDRRRVPVDRLSGGEAQRLYIAAACVHAPDLLILDEPTAHLDPPAKREIGAWLREMGGARAILLSTHDLREAEAVCDEALFLVAGEVKAAGPIAALVDAVPAAARHGRGLEDAFFHHCGSRIGAAGEHQA